MRIFKRRGSEVIDPQLTGLRFDQVGTHQILSIISNILYTCTQTRGLQITDRLDVNVTSHSESHMT